MEQLSYGHTVEWLYNPTDGLGLLTVEGLDAGNYSIEDIEDEAAGNGVRLSRGALYAWANGRE